MIFSKFLKVQIRRKLLKITPDGPIIVIVLLLKSKDYGTAESVVVVVHCVHTTVSLNCKFRWIYALLLNEEVVNCLCTLLTKNLVARRRTCLLVSVT